MKDNTMSLQLPLDAIAIRKLIPHRYPFVLVDRITEFEPYKRIVGYKNVTQNEPFFNGHFPDRPIMPGVLLIEAMAQAAGLLTLVSRGNPESSSHFYLVKIDDARFSRMVVPGDRVDLHAELTKSIRNMAIYSCEAKVDGQLAACATVMCAEDKGA